MDELDKWKKELEELKNKKTSLEKECAGHEAVLKSYLEELNKNYGFSSLEEAEEETIKIEEKVHALESSLNEKVFELNSMLSELEATLGK